MCSLKTRHAQTYVFFGQGGGVVQDIAQKAAGNGAEGDQRCTYVFTGRYRAQFGIARPQ